MLVRRPDGAPVEVADDGYVWLPAAAILGYDHELIEADDDGNIQLPAAAAPEYGDGLEINAGALVPAVLVGDVDWPLLDLGGSAFIGDPEDFPGFMSPLVRHETGLWGLPDHTAARATFGAVIEGDQLTSVTGSFDSDPSPGGSSIWKITNPSASRRMAVLRSMQGIAQVTVPVDGGCDMILQERINGGAWTAVRTLRPAEPTSGTQSIRQDVQFIKPKSSVIAAGATLEVELRFHITKTGVGDTAHSPVLLNASAAVELFGVTV